MAGAHDVLTVVTQPDRPSGRGLQHKPSAVKKRATEIGLHVLTPDRLDAPFLQSIAQLRPQLLACVSYGKILPPAVLAIDGMAPLNVHPSLLPEYRGAAPIQSALRDGRALTGVSIIWMTPKMDAGDIVLQKEVAIGENETFGRLHDRLAGVGAKMLTEAAALLAEGALTRHPQDEARATYTKPISKDDLQIRFDATAKAVVDLVRSASPAPGAWTLFDGKRLKVIDARAEPLGSPDVTGEGPSIRASDGVVRLLSVVPEGRREMSGGEFARTRSKS